jgi:hypothetical protein
MKDQITPSWKSDTMNGELDLLSQIIWNGKDRQTCIEDGICLTCDESKGLKATSFRDDISRKEYAISAMCQSCQDDIFGVGDDEDDGFDDDWPEDSYSDAEADADTLASAGMGTDEDYGCF